MRSCLQYDTVGTGGNSSTADIFTGVWEQEFIPGETSPFPAPVVVLIASGLAHVVITVASDSTCLKKREKVGND